MTTRVGGCGGGLTDVDRYGGRWRKGMGAMSFVRRSSAASAASAVKRGTKTLARTPSAASTEAAREAGRALQPRRTASLSGAAGAVKRTSSSGSNKSGAEAEGGRAGAEDEAVGAGFTRVLSAARLALDAASNDKESHPPGQVSFVFVRLRPWPPLIWLTLIDKTRNTRQLGAFTRVLSSSAAFARVMSGGAGASTAPAASPEQELDDAAARAHSQLEARRKQERARARREEEEAKLRDALGRRLQVRAPDAVGARRRAGSAPMASRGDGIQRAVTLQWHPARDSVAMCSSGGLGCSAGGKWGRTRVGALLGRLMVSPARCLDSLSFDSLFGFLVAFNSVSPARAGMRSRQA